MGVGILVGLAAGDGDAETTGVGLAIGETDNVGVAVETGPATLSPVFVDTQAATTAIITTKEMMKPLFMLFKKFIYLGFKNREWLSPYNGFTVNKCRGSSRDAIRGAVLKIFINL